MPAVRSHDHLAPGTAGDASVRAGERARSHDERLCAASGSQLRSTASGSGACPASAASCQQPAKSWRSWAWTAGSDVAPVALVAAERRRAGFERVCRWFHQSAAEAIRRPASRERGGTHVDAPGLCARRFRGRIGHGRGPGRYSSCERRAFVVGAAGFRPWFRRRLVSQFASPRAATSSQRQGIGRL